MTEILRTAHGTAADALLVAERPPVDELRPLNAADTEQGLAEAKRRGRPFTLNNKAAANKRTALARMAPEVPTADPRYRKALRSARRYVQRRIRELAVQHGGHLGSGPCAGLTSAGLALAASRVLHELAAETLDPALFVSAARLADSARQQELTAVALAERESAARLATAPRESDLERLQREARERATRAALAGKETP